MALLPRLVGEARLGPASALLHTVQDLGVLIGPAIGAILLGVAPAWIAFLANGATFAVSALLISAMRPDAAPAGGAASGVAQLAGGLRTVRTTAFAPWLIVIVAMVEFTYGAQTVQLVVYARHSLALGSGGYGILLTAVGLGGLLSAAANGRPAASRRVSLIVIITGSLACATELAYAGVQVRTIALAVTVIGNAGLVSCEVVGETALARIAPRRRARARDRDLQRGVGGCDGRWRGPGVPSRGVHVVAGQLADPRRRRPANHPPLSAWPARSRCAQCAAGRRAWRAPGDRRRAAALGLPGNPPEAVDAARSKVRTRELSERLGLPTPKAQRVRSLDELFAAAADVGFPAVVKPEFDSIESLPGVYKLVRSVVTPERKAIFRAGSDLLLEEYLDGVEFDVDQILQDGECVFSSVSQNWPTAEPSFQETGLHLPPDHNKRAVRGLVDLSGQTVQSFGFRRGVLHVEGKCTSRGPRVIEVNARMGGTRIYQMVEAVWGVDLIEAQLRSCLDLPQTLKPSRRPGARHLWRDRPGRCRPRQHVRDGARRVDAQRQAPAACTVAGRPGTARATANRPGLASPRSSPNSCSRAPVAPAANDRAEAAAGDELELLPATDDPAHLLL